MRQLLVLAAMGGALVTVPQLASAQVTQQTITGTPAGSQTIGNNAGEDEGIDVGFDPTAYVEGYVSITGTGAINYHADTAVNTINSAGAAGSTLAVTASDQVTGPTVVTPGSITVTTSGNISSEQTGILAVNHGTGNIDIDTTAATIYADTDNFGETGIAINSLIDNTTSTGDIIIETGNVYANGGVGLTTTNISSVVAAANNGTGNINITVNGDARSVAYADTSDPTAGFSGIGGAWAGISAKIGNANSDGNITIIAQDNGVIDGLDDAISAQNLGLGNIRIDTTASTVNGDNDGGLGNGIFAQIENNASSGDITITTGNVTSNNESAINANNAGKGDVTITTEGNVSNNGGGSTIWAGNSIPLVFDGTYNGSISVTANGDVTNAGGGHGIEVYNEHLGLDTDLTRSTTTVVTSGNVTAGGDGIHVWNADDVGEADTHTDINITANAGSVTGGGYGIYARNDGRYDSNTTIDTVGAEITGRGGIYALNSNTLGTGEIDITTENVSALDTAIEADESGTGAITVDSTAGTLYADTDNGGLGLAVNAIIRSGNSDADITITTADAYANGGAGTPTTLINSVIAAANRGTGGISIDTTEGEVKSIVYNDPTNGDYGENGLGSASGISALISNVSATGDIDIKTGDVTSNFWGVHAVNAGTGDTNVDTRGPDGDATVTGVLPGPLGEFDGIYAENSQGNVNVLAHNVYGDDHGIHVQTNSSADNATRSGNVTVDGTVAGYYSGIYQWGYTSQNTTIEEGGVVKTIQIANPDTPQDFPIEVATTRNAIIIDGYHDAAGNGLLNTINNSGTVIGNIISWDEGTDVINNYGIWNNAGGTSNLTDDDDTINNHLGGAYLAANQAGTSYTQIRFAENVNDLGGDFVMQNRDERITGDPASNDPEDPNYANFDAFVGDVIYMPESTFVTGGGNLLVDTDFAIGQSDELYVQNITLGGATTLVNVNVVDGLGQPTAPYNGGDGILIADVSGTSDADALQLQNELRGGLYTYSLDQGQSDTQSWFLQAAFNEEALAAGSASVMGSRSALASLSNLHDRQRDVETIADYSESRKGVWGRVFGQGNDFETTVSDGSGTTAVSGFDSDLWGVQAGLDFLAKGDEAGNRKYAGLYVAYADNSGHYTNNGERIGKMEMNTTSLGLYYTKYTDSNWYLDLVGQYSHLGSAKIKSAENDIKTGGNSYALSLEVGKQFNPKGSIISEVQAQLIDQYTEMDDITLNDGSQLNVSSVNAVTGRLGVRLYGNPRDEGKSFLPWVRANLWHTFSTSSKVSSLGNTLSTPIGGTSGELEIGFSKGNAESGGWGFYGSAGYLFDLGGAEYSGWKGTLGLRKGW